MLIFYQFIILLVTHWVADFVLQTHWQASNKSKSNEALGRHVLNYTIVLGFAATLIAPTGWQALAFTAVNGALHFITDYFTSRWSSRHFGMAIRDTHAIMTWADTYKKPPDDAQMALMEVFPGRHYHNFFVIIGLDQLIHQLTLALTLWALVW